MRGVGNQGERETLFEGGLVIERCLLSGGKDTYSDSNDQEVVMVVRRLYEMCMHIPGVMGEHRGHGINPPERVITWATVTKWNEIHNRVRVQHTTSFSTSLSRLFCG